MRRIDLATWPRRQHLALYATYADPIYELSMRVDATGVRAAARAAGHGAFSVVLHALVSAANEVPELRTRLVDGAPVEVPRVHPGWVVLAPDETMRFAFCDLDDDLDRFDAAVRAAGAAAAARPELVLGDGRLDVIFASCLPRLDLVGARPERSGRRDDATPHLVWGAIAPEAGGREVFTLTASAHHGLVDGLHLTRLAHRAEARLAAYVGR